MQKKNEKTKIFLLKAEEVAGLFPDLCLVFGRIT
jgi:hypothetical protein